MFAISQVRGRSFTVTLRVVMLSGAFSYCHVVRRYAKCRNVERRGTKLRYSQFQTPESRIK
jgi:hypothetical protein